MEDERRRDIGLFRYSLVREPGDPGLSGAQRGELVRDLAAIDHAGPDGTRLRVGRSTLDRWVRLWRAGGFEALVPAARVTECRTPAEVLALGEALKREVPARTAAQVAAIMAASGGPGCSTRTLQRHFARLGLSTSPDGSPPRAFGRFQASAPNELWTGDALHGPTVAGRKAYLLAFIDDFSRALPAHLWTNAPGHGPSGRSLPPWGGVARRAQSGARGPGLGVRRRAAPPGDARYWEPASSMRSLGRRPPRGRSRGFSGR